MREQWRTKCRRRPRRGAESLRGSQAVDSVGIERRISPPPRRGAMLTFRPSLPDRMTQETGKRPDGAAAAILAVRPARTPRHDFTKGFRASAWPPSTVRTPLFVRHSRQINHSKERCLVFSGLTRVITCLITGQPFPREFRTFAIDLFRYISRKFRGLMIS